MIRKKRTEITIETDRIVVISRRRLSARAWCKSCGRQVSMVTADEAARLAPVTSRTIYAWVEAGRLHSMKMSDGRLLICLESIPPSGLIDAGPSDEHK
ncbi:MAG TPA: helix-turn-helix domain-containing protein [Blastocatellia bacterium]|nr:helix-turn-helix domain-containing protein [Blastocatellia bacterium]